jgi:hypothetical protein
LFEAGRATDLSGRRDSFCAFLSDADLTQFRQAADQSFFTPFGLLADQSRIFSVSIAISADVSPSPLA